MTAPRLSDDDLRLFAQHHTDYGRAMAEELLAARALLREVHLRASSGTGYIPAELENRLRAALNEETNDGN